MREIGRRLPVLFRRGRFERDLEEEMQVHFELQAEENQANGMGAREARCAARRQFGNAATLKVAGWKMWGWTPAEQF